MEMLGSTIDTVSMTIAVTREKVAQLRALLAEWPTEMRVATIKKVWSLLGKLLHLCEVVRLGKFFVRRILNHLGLAPLKAGEGTGNGFAVGGKQRRGCVGLSREFHDDLASWRIVVEMATGPNGITGTAPRTGALDLISAVLASSSSADQLRNRLNAITRQVSGLGASFVG